MQQSWAARAEIAVMRMLAVAANGGRTATDVRPRFTARTDLPAAVFILATASQPASTRPPPSYSLDLLLELQVQRALRQPLTLLQGPLQALQLLMQAPLLLALLVQMPLLERQGLLAPLRVQPPAPPLQAQRLLGGCRCSWCYCSR